MSESQSAGPGDSTVSKEVVTVFHGRLTKARRAAGQAKSSVQQGGASGSRCQERSVWHGAALACGARLSQQWSGACLSYTLKVVDSTLLGLLISVLAPLMASGEFPQEPIHRWFCSTDMVVLITCVDILGYPLARCVCSDLLASFLNQSVITDWQSSWLT